MSETLSNTNTGDILIFSPTYGLKRVVKVLKTTATRVYISETHWLRRDGSEPGDATFQRGYAHIPKPGEIQEVTRVRLAEKLATLKHHEWYSLGLVPLREIEAILSDPKSKEGGK